MATSQGSKGPLRPMPKIDGGTVGRPIKLYANYFEVTFKNFDLDIYHYDVKIIEWPIGYEFSSTERKPLKRKIFKTMMEKWPDEYQCMGYDGEMSAFTVKGLPSELLDEINNSHHQVMHDNGRKKTYKVVLKFVNHETLKKLFDAMKSKNSILNTSITSILQMLEVMFRHSNFNHHIMVGLNNFLPLKDMYSKPKYINANLTKRCVLGFFASLRPAVWKDIPKILLNFDVSHKPSYVRQDVLQFMKKELDIPDSRLKEGGFRLKDRELGKFSELMKDIKIKTKYNGFKTTVIGVSKDSAYDIKMTWWTEERIYEEKELDLKIIGNRRTKRGDTNSVDDCESMIDEVQVEGTVADYMLIRYSAKLKYRHLNCLQLHPEIMKKYIPIELCEIPDGEYVKKPLSDSEKRSFLKASGGCSRNAKERLIKTEDVLEKQDYNNSSSTVTSLQMEISDKPIMTDGRVLPTPVLQMGKNRDINPREGEWDPRHKIFFHPAKLTSWAVYNYSKRVEQDKVMEFVNKLIEMAKDRGCEMSLPIYKENGLQPNPSVDFPQLISEKKDLKLILVVLPKEKIKGKIYEPVKFAGDREVKILTAGVQESNIQKSGGDVISNVLQKINAKLGGVSTVLKGNEHLFVMKKENFVMFVGIDVNHPPAGDKSTPSLAAVVGSMDQHVSQYALELRHQRHRTEIIREQMQDIFKKLLLAFYNHESYQRKPQRIIVYRDGVSDTEFETVLNSELLAIRKACMSFPGTYRPGITFIVLQKTTHTRLYCQNDKDGVGTANNIPPGTVVDRDITSPWYTEFHLAAHKSNFGTSKPGRYCVLWDDNNLTMDNLQIMTYAMCHLYEPCTKTVSQPAPTYYAHHAAKRAKLYIKHLCKDDGQIPPDQEIANAINFGPDHPLRKTLFYL